MLYSNETRALIANARFCHFCTANRRVSLYRPTLQRAAPCLKIAPSHGASGPRLIHGFLGSRESSTQTASRSIQWDSSLEPLILRSHTCYHKTTATCLREFGPATGETHRHTDDGIIHDWVSSYIDGGIHDSSACTKPKLLEPEVGAVIRD